MNNRIFIVAHAPLAQALKACAMHVYPECAAEVLALDVKADDTPEQSLRAAQQWARDRKAKIIAGVNLPMLLRSVCYRHEPIEGLVQRAMTGGALGVVEISPPV